MTLRPRSLFLVRLGLKTWLVLLLLFGAMTAVAAAAPTTLKTTLSGGGKEGEEITVAEGSGVKDQATLSGENAAKATGTVKYAVYSDNKCEKLVTKAGEVAVKEGKVPASEEKKLEAAAVSYWQADYSGDALNAASKSICGKEVLAVKASTTLKTTLSGGGKEGEEITVAEGIGVKDQATLSGTKSSTATGTVKYSVYTDKGCKELVTKAGEGAVEGGKAAGSEEKKLEAGAVYYWQAVYGGDALHEPSTSTCGKEVLTVKASTTLKTTLSGGGKEGEEITVAEGSGVKDQAALSGTNAAKATGTVKYAVYSDNKCEKLVTKAGEGTVTPGSVPASEEKKLEAAAIYYWQAVYSGDSSHDGSTSSCGKEVLAVKATMSLSTALVGGGEEGEEISVAEGTFVADTATLSGTKVDTATGTVKYFVYSDPECKKLVSEAGEVSVEEGIVPSSEEEELEAGNYYWQAVYSGDSLHAGVTAPCTEIAVVKAATSLTTSLSGEGNEGDEITVTEGAPVVDTATLSGPNAAEATGTVKYSVYSDPECEELVAEAGEVSVSGESVAASDEEALEPGIYFWQVEYSGDVANYSSITACGSDIELVVPRLTTTLSGGEQSDAEIEVTEGTGVSDKATLHGEHASEATGTVKYFIYSDDECEELTAKAGEVSVSGASVPSSEEKELGSGTYYWQAEYSGDEKNPPATGICGAEILVVVTPTSLTASLSGGGKEGKEIEVKEGTTVSAQATLSGTNTSKAEGFVEYSVYSDSKCTQVAAQADMPLVSEGSVPPSEEVTLPAGTYYWQAKYSGDGVNQGSATTCGSEILVVTWPITMTLSAGEQTGTEVEVIEEIPVSAKATLHGDHASEATGTVEYFIYSDPECEELVVEAGEVSVSGASVPSSEEKELESGTYYWQAEYSGDGQNPASTTVCGPVQVTEINRLVDQYAALGDSYSSGLGLEHPDGVHAIGTYYQHTNYPWWWLPGPHVNKCSRSEAAWPALLATSIFGAGVAMPPAIFLPQPAHFIFRACRSARTINIWRTGGGIPAVLGGQWDEFFVATPPGWVTTPAQSLWLAVPGGNPQGNPNNVIKLVTMTIGGNDAGFREVGLHCTQWPWQQGPYSPLGCQATINAREGAGFATISAELPAVLTQIRQLAPAARIRIPMYPRVINWARGGNINIGWGARVNNAVVGLGGITAARAIDRFVWNLNRRLVEVVRAWEAVHGGDAKVVAATEDAFADHKLGDAQPWLNPLVLPSFIESFHPNACGHRAIALEVMPIIRGGGFAPPPPFC